MDGERRGDLGDIVRNLSSSSSPSSSSSKAFESPPVPEAKDFPPLLQFTDSLPNIPSYPLLPESLGAVSGDGLYSGHNNLHKAALVEEMYHTCPCDILSTTVHQISPSPTTSQQGVLPEAPPLLLADAAMELNYHVLPDATAIAQIPSPTSQSIKRRKSQAKKVVCIPAPANAGCRQSGEVVPSDLWAWRKYGQKPIKGSPYPRGYYRCSSSKGCSARKQVERSRTDPNMLVITYTSEHNHPWPTHRNALAGSTRSQPTKVPSSSSRIATASIDIQRAEHVDQSVQAEEATSTGGNVTERVQFHHHQPAVNFDDQLFADLGELGPEPVDQMVLSKDLLGDRLEEGMSDKALDPFGLLDWGSGSTAANSSHSSMARKG